MVYSCSAELICRDTQGFMEIMDRFVEKHGSFMEMMRGLLDFNLFCLLPCRASFVAGFAKAYELSGEDLRLIRHRDEQGHVVNKREPG